MILLSTLLALPASGFAPSDRVVTGVEPSRVRVDHPMVQAEFERSEAWQRFLATDGYNWRARFDEAAHSPSFLWGQGIPMPSDEVAIERQLRQLIERHSELFGLADAELSLKSIHYNSTYDTWYVDFDALRDGVATYRGGLSAYIKHGNLIAFKVATDPRAPVTGSWSIPEVDAVQLAVAQGPAPDATHLEPTVVPQLLEQQTQHGLELRRVYWVRSRTQDPPGQWNTFVDAENGHILGLWNDYKFINGNVQITHHERTIGDPLIQDPAEDAVVTGDSDQDVTDANGDYTVTTGNNYSTKLSTGRYVQVFNDSGAEGSLSSSNANLVWTSSNATQAELDTYIYVHQVRAWADGVDPTVPWTYQQFEAHDNESQTCNAFFDGANLNFFVAGGGCNNTGQIADVVYHEWGHGFHAFSIQSGTFDGSLSEGAADTVAFFNTGDNVIGPGFFTNGGGIRDVAPDAKYPDDYNTFCYSGYCDPHANGLIFGGAMWDLWDDLVKDLGDPDGTTAAEAIFAGLLKFGPGIPDSYDAAVLADDDDGNLSNGTPHICQINDAFGRHGLGPGGGQVSGAEVLVPLTAPPQFTPSDTDTEFQFELQSTAPECFTATPKKGTLHYRINGGGEQKIDATVNGADMTASIPAQPIDTFVEYWFDGTDTQGNSFQAPFSGAIAPYTMFVGEVIKIGCEDFEASDGGYQHELVSGTPGDGADDWTWGAPAGQSDDPSAAFSGSNEWGNDLGITIGGQTYDGLYQADKHNRLYSPALDTKWYTDVFLQYRRWLNVEDGFCDQAFITLNGDTVWSNYVADCYSNDDSQDREWISHSVDLQRKADQSTQNVLSWELQSDPGKQLGGWNIDDVCLYAPMTPDNRLAIVDFVAQDQGGPIGLSWTNPQYDPVDRVVVVRNVDHYPKNWKDGDLLIDINNPKAGEAVEAVHGNADGQSGYYAVYAFDGTDWLSWTIEGWNADHADPNAGGNGSTGTVGPDGTVNTSTGGTDSFPDGTDTGVKTPGGCACDSSFDATLAWPAVGLLLLVRRKRAVRG